MLIPGAFLLAALAFQATLVYTWDEIQMKGNG